MTRAQFSALVFVLVSSAGTSAFGVENSAVKLEKVYISTALQDLTFDIKRGEIVSIIGPSGAGKSTFINILTGILPPTKGKYILNGKDLDGLSAAERKKFLVGEIGYIPYPPELEPKLTVFETLGAALSAGEIPTVKIDPELQEILSLLGLEEQGRTRVGELSGGQQQRVAIARALVDDPSIIIADEPTANLDRQAADEVVNLLRELRTEDRTVVLITHDSQLAERADRIILLSEQDEEDDKHK